MGLFQLPLIVALVCILTAPALASPAGTPPVPRWRIAGDLSEACTCSVPCTCNFGESPSPHSFCWALFSLDIHQGRYFSVKLDGLRLAAGAGAKGIVFYIDDRATPEQAKALKAIARQIWSRVREITAAQNPAALSDPQMTLLGFKTVRIDQEVGQKNNRLEIGSAGAFESRYLLGIDGQTPVVVENNWSWNIQHGIKGKTKRLHYKDEFGNDFDMTDTNANQGQFDWNDKTAVYLR
jgi:hypothetical protein